MIGLGTPYQDWRSVVSSAWVYRVIIVASALHTLGAVRLASFFGFKFEQET